MPLSFELNAGTDTHVSLVKQMLEDITLWYKRELENDKIAKVTDMTSVLHNLSDLNLLLVMKNTSDEVYDRFVRLIEPNPTVFTVLRLESLYVFMTVKYGSKFMEQYTDDFFGAAEKILTTNGKPVKINRSYYPAWIALHPLIQQVYFSLPK